MCDLHNRATIAGGPALPSPARSEAGAVLETKGEFMAVDPIARVASDPKYLELKAKRSRFGWWLTLAMLAVYYGFILLVAFDKPFLSRRIGEGVTTIGMPIGLGVILFTIAITAFYVRRANREFDALTDEIVRGALK
jgi:uncharacterized membrane protein (DUF485 family)